MAFNIPGESNLDELYCTDTWLYEQFAGDGSLWSWGYNAQGQLGDNTVAAKSSPVQTIAGGTNWVQVATGSYFSVAIKTDGTLWGWGDNQYGQLGVTPTTNRSSPVQTLTGGTTWKQVTCGIQHTLAVKTDGTLWGWGRDQYGQLGQNSTNGLRSSPTQTIAGGNNWKQVSTSDYHTAAIKTDGTLWTWGWNSYGQLGDNTRTDKVSPIQTISGGTNWKQVNCGSASTAAIKTDGTLWIWGGNYIGQLGTGNTFSVSSPVQTIAGGNTWKTVAGSGAHTLAIKTDGTLWCWGANSNGQLGDNTTTNKSSPIQTITGGTNWKGVSGGVNTTAAIKTDGTLWVCGYNNNGQLGTNDRTSRSSPVQTVAGGNNWRQAMLRETHTTAIKTTNINIGE
jgi:alpha-tubulin suppressor-like RCC1 family protein